MNITMKLEALLKALSCGPVVDCRNRDVTAVVCDSRQVRPGALYVAVRGDKLDGAAFIDDALERGAVAVVGEANLVPKKEACYVRVPDAHRALAELSCAFNHSPADSLRMYGITGTNGKTTTAYLIRHILRSAGQPTGLITTVEYEIGVRSIPASRTTPEAPLLQSLLAQIRAAGCVNAVMEVSSHSLVQKRIIGIDYDCAIFTNLTRDHLDYHLNRDNYFAAKAILFKELGRGRKKATGVINMDDPRGAELVSMTTGAPVITYGIREAADVRAVDLRLGADGAQFRVVSPWGEAVINSRLMGRFNVSNVLAAVAACASGGLDLKQVAAAVPGMGSVPGRLQEVATNRDFQVFVDYAHTDDALENVLVTLREITRKRLLVVFGCGGNRDATKRPAMGAVAGRLADHSIITSDNPRKEDPARIIDDILKGVAKDASYDVVPDRREAIRKAVGMARPGDVVLVAGKGHETFQEFANTTMPFDDRLVVAECLA